MWMLYGKLCTPVLQMGLLQQDMGIYQVVDGDFTTNDNSQAYLQIYVQRMLKENFGKI